MPDDDDREQDEPQQIALMRRMVELAVQRTEMAAQRTEMATRRTEMAAQRTEMSAQRSYMNAERTLSVWVRTALAVMVVGVAVDRFGLFMLERPGSGGTADTASKWIGVALVALSVLVAVLTAVRFRFYVSRYRRVHELPDRHGPLLPPAFASLVALFGIALIVLLVVAAR